MFLFDRLYGQLRFPALIRELLDCPGLLRLKEVRQGNVPFVSFPSFAAVSRYEHSLGVCYLAQLCAERLGFSDKEKIELMIAALYHDVATPPFAHTVEEVLSPLGFNHETRLKELITGVSADTLKERAQVFLGRQLKLNQFFQLMEVRGLKIDRDRIAKIITGKDTDLVKSDGMDLDNIDNVIRAATAMGITSCEPTVAIRLAKSFVKHKRGFAFEEFAREDIVKWQKTRELLYFMINASKVDFAVQTMIKHAVRLLMDSESQYRLTDKDWCLTDEELLRERLAEHNRSSEIVNRIRLAGPYSCLALLWIEGKEAVSELTRARSSLVEVEKIARVFYREAQDSRFPKDKGSKRKKKSPEVVTNFILDKRFRAPGRPLVFLGQEYEFEMKPHKPAALLGVFTPLSYIWSNKIKQEFIKELKRKVFSNAKVSKFRPSTEEL